MTDEQRAREVAQDILDRLDGRLTIEDRTENRSNLEIVTSAILTLMQQARREGAADLRQISPEATQFIEEEIELLEAMDDDTPMIGLLRNMLDWHGASEQTAAAISARTDTTEREDG